MIIENLSGCTVVLPFAIKCIYVKNINSCRIYVGCCSGACFVDKAIDSAVLIQSHQIRIHNSENTKFYLTAKSNPIIEHCTRMGFGPFISGDSQALSYPQAKEQAREAGLELEPEKNLFDRVLDFNWHKQDKSPNWDVVDFPPSELVLNLGE